MDRGLYVSASGMLAEQARQDIIANNLANVGTPGYKADTTVQEDFAELLMHNRQTGAAIGRSSFGVLARSVTPFTQGNLDRTENPLDMGLQGNGFFAVQTPQGVQYTRNGRFTLSDGVLANASGFPVLGVNGQPIAINSSEVVVSRTGEVRSGGNVVGNLAVVTLNNPRKSGGDLVVGNPQGQSNAIVQQGSIETSTSDPTRSIIDSIASLRNFEANQRVLRTIDESLSRAAQLAQVNNA